MTFAEWLNWACKNRGKEAKRKFHEYLLPELKLRDGTSLSVQASEWHLCDPAETFDDGSKYENVEVYTHGRYPEGFYPENETSPYTFARVDIERMERICEMHGGIKFEEG